MVVITKAIPLLLLPYDNFLEVSEILNHSDTCAVPSVCNAHLTQALPRLHLSSAADDRKIVSYLHIHLFSNVLHRRRRVSPRRPMYLLIVGSHYCVMHFAYALHMCRQNLVLFACLYIKLFELVIKNHLPLLHHASLPQN